MTHKKKKHPVNWQKIMAIIIISYYYKIIIIIHLITLL